MKYQELLIPDGYTIIESTKEYDIRSQFIKYIIKQKIPRFLRSGKIVLEGSHVSVICWPAPLQKTILPAQTAYFLKYAIVSDGTIW